MALVSTGDFAASLAPSMPKYYGLGYDRFPKLYEEIFEVGDMDGAFLEDYLISGMGTARQTAEQESTPYDRMHQAWPTRYAPSDFRLGLIVSANMIADGKAINIMEKKTKAMGVAVNETCNIIAHNVINRATSSVQLGGDGVALLSASHPTSSGITWSNKPSNDADLSEAALEQAYIDMGNFVDDRGLKVRAYPRKLIVPRALAFEQQRILGGDFRVGTSDNDINALRNNGTFPEPTLVDDYITSPTAWYIKTSLDSDGLKFYWRKRVELSNDTHFDTDAAKFKLHFRIAVGFTDPRCLYGCVGP